MRSGPGRPKRHGVRNPAGTKVARQFARNAGRVVTGSKWDGGVYHTFAITAENDQRAGRPKGWARWRP